MTIRHKKVDGGLACARALLLLLLGYCFCEPARADFVGLECRAGVWWFKAPSGALFLSTGVNHVEPMYWQSPNNRAFVREMYGPELFAPDGSLCDGSPAADKWGRRVAATLAEWGFNTLGFHNPLSQSLRSAGDAYHVVQLDLPVPWGWNMPRSALVAAFKRRPFDIFDVALTGMIHSNAAHWVTAYADDPRVLGYAYTDGPPWTVEDDVAAPAFEALSPAEKTMHPWVLALMSLPANAQGKQAWLRMMRTRYASAAAAAAVYACEASTWDALAAGVRWSSICDRQRAEEDSQAFLVEIMRRWYALRQDAIRKYDRHHLILGDKLNMNRDAKYPAELCRSLQVMKTYVDVINIQFYGTFDKQREALALLHRETQLPILNGDTTCNPIWKDIPSDNTDYYRQLGQTLAENVARFFALPYVVGWHHCGYMRGLRRPYVEALKRGDTQTIATHQKNRTTFREGFFTEQEEPIEVILQPLRAAFTAGETAHRAAETR